MADKTKEEIAAFCAKLDSLHGITRPGGMIFVDAVQIIRQLQAELKLYQVRGSVTVGKTEG